MPDLADVVIVGGGILGAALACELTRRTLRVVLLETHALGSGATGSSFAWVNATAKLDNEAYHRLNALGLARYDALAAEWGVDKIGLHSGGALFWAAGADTAGREQLRQRAARLQAWGYPVARLDAAELQTLEPQLDLRSQEEAEGLFAPADRWVDTSRLLRCLVEQARERGADLREYCPATGFTRSVVGSISTVETPQGRIATRWLILAAGTQTPALLAQVTGDPADRERFPVQRVPGLLVETPPGSAPGVLHRVLFPPDAGVLHLRPTPGGGLLLGADDMDAALAEAEQQDSGKATISAFLEDASARLLMRTAQALSALSLATLHSRATSRICVRPMPGDGLPIVGPLPAMQGVFVAVTHSGITLGPLLAHLLAEEIVSGRVPPLLAAYRPARFLT
jgi:glycine/D-amino acid oxidase-like deaminating enzyme